ncbi:MAG: phage portal protein [Acutalibacteraceae bacterium]
MDEQTRRAVKNAAKKFYAKGYSDAGASLTKRALKGFTAESGHPKEDIDYNNHILRQRCRMLYMASPIAAGAINTSRTKIVGSGIHLNSSINYDLLGISQDEARKWQKNVEAEWKLWAESKRNCDALGMSSFYGLEQIALKSWLMSGDVFAVLKRAKATPLNPYTLRIQLVEADRVRTPSDFGKEYAWSLTDGKNPNTGNNVYDGVEVDADGKVVAYHICNTYPYQITGKSPKWQRVLAEGERTGLPNVLQIMDAERPDQYRGVSILAVAIEMLLQLRRYTESELIAALVQSYLTAWIITESDPTDFPFNEIGGGEGIESIEVDEVSDDEDEYEIGPGTINHLKPGESVVLGNPNIPTAGFEAFVKALCKMIGAAIEIPYDVLLKEFNSSYSAAKGALEEGWEMFKMRRANLIENFCQPVYEIWLAEAIAIGRIKAPGFFNDPKIRKAWCGARWDGPAQTHLDPVKEAKANETLVAHGWKTNAQVTRESYGGNFEENISELSEEAQLMSQKMFTPTTNNSQGGEPTE